MKTGIGLAAMICGIIGSGAAAEMVTETLTFTDEYSIFLPYDGFDSGLGTLTGVLAVLDGTASIADGEVTGTFGGEFPDLFSTFVEGYFQVNGSGLIWLSSFLDGYPVSCFPALYPSGTCTVA